MDLTRYIAAYDPTSSTVPVYLVSGIDAFESLDTLTGPQKKWLTATGFDAKPGSHATFMDQDGALAGVVASVKDGDFWALAKVSSALESGRYVIANTETTHAHVVAWMLGKYSFDRYKTPKSDKCPVLMLPDGFCGKQAGAEAEAITLVRDLVNTPTEDMGPTDLQDTAEALAEEFGATCQTIIGDDLLDENFPAIHTVGRAAAAGREPRIIDLCWGREDAPKVTLVGKGVCFDTGGLDLKPSQFMRWMKKDMGGAAHVLGLARLLMTTNVDIRLRVLISAVENAVDGNAFRPGDILNTRKGLTVENGNTDAEGRLVLCDALTLACEESPELLIDFATLTGAARVALGADLPATYTNSEDVWNTLENCSKEAADPLWRLPLYGDYDSQLDSNIADLSNISESPFAGSITAALYLQRFITEGTDWLHLDVFAWNQSARPGRPKGGEAQALRAVYGLIKSRFTAS
ncbi:leucyl aminopeptidase [Kordiimonas sediminis]|uniref:Leucyl aminopeptidase n=1 Tax=Kordiimonas sediminis TaxID=1735581 RepID=A0A919E4N4_9PROT|nr:leucyl aminopeptidase family protein [Kordiimonas sediminis]GHF12731.1 leucyl aminopeptidase [Kordiimonas sediminis]